MQPTDERTLPQAATLQAALRATTERLALELHCPAAEAPDWSDFEWRVAMAAMVMHGVTALLASRLRWRGPPAWQAFLGEQQTQGVFRQTRTQELLAALDDAARRAQLPLVALKGSALLGLALYAPGERPMSDIDLLCAPEHLEATGRLVEGLGYVAGVEVRRHREYLPKTTTPGRAFGEHIDNPIKVELHAHIAEHLPLRSVDITARVLPPGVHAGVNAYPSLAALMGHLLLHAAGNVCLRGVRLIQLQDVALLAGRLGTADWETLWPGAADSRDAWWALPPLSLVERYFPGHVPTTVLSRAAAACPPVLRRAALGWQLSDVSLSRLGTPMLPGIEWSHSLGEAFAWARTRLHPGHDIVDISRKAALGHHALAGSAWIRQSRLRKALRLLCGRAPRAATLYTVQAALDYRPLATSSAYSDSNRALV